MSGAPEACCYGGAMCKHNPNSREYEAASEPLAAMGNMRVKFWTCPDHRRTGQVGWLDDLATCLVPGCVRTSRKPDPKPYLCACPTQDPRPCAIHGPFAKPDPEAS